MCTISINPSSVVASPVSGQSGLIDVTVSGTVANCSSNQIKVVIDCGGTPPTVMATITGSNWTATARTSCPCGSNVAISVTCLDPIPCSDFLRINPLLCNCCPILSMPQPCIQYDPSGVALVRVEADVIIPPGCAPVILQLDYGDGSPLAPPETFNNTSGQQQSYVYPSTPAVHAYAPGHTRTVTVTVLSPPGCGAQQGTITINQLPPCATKPFLSLMCKLAYALILFSAPVAAVLWAAYAFGCSASTVFSAAIGASITAGVFLLFYFLLCTDCDCKPLLRLVSQCLIVTGILLLLFAFRPTCVAFLNALSASSQTWWVLGAAALLLVIGFTSLYKTWYLGSCCFITFCDFLKAVILAMVVAFVAAIFVFLVLTPTFCSGQGLLLALMVANFILTLAGILQNWAKC